MGGLCFGEPVLLWGRLLYFVRTMWERLSKTSIAKPTAYTNKAQLWAGHRCSSRRSIQKPCKAGIAKIPLLHTESGRAKTGTQAEGLVA